MAHRSATTANPMKLAQEQVWKKDDQYLRIVTWARMSIEYQQMPGLETKEGPMLTVTKKEFCRLIKGAELVREPGS